MNELLEAFNLDEALRSFEDLDLCSACAALLQVLGYTYISDHTFDDESVDQFIYFSAPKRMYFNTSERMYLSKISTLKHIGEATQNDLLGEGYAQKKLIFISVELNCNTSSRSETSYHIAQIINKLFDDYVLVIFAHGNNIEFCTCSDTVYMSDWFNTSNPSLSELFSLIQLSPSYICGAKNIEEYYMDLSFSLSRDYIKYPESYEYLAYECFPKIISDGEIKLSKELVNEVTVKNRKYYMDSYGDDYVLTDDSVMGIADNDEDWTLFELEESIPPDAQDELDFEYFDDELIDVDDDTIDCSEISEEVLGDPVKLLEYLESLSRKTKGSEI